MYNGHFRHLDSALPRLNIRDKKLSPLILVKANGEARFGTQPEKKDELVAEYVEGEDLLLWAWVGKFSTDVFELTAEDIRNHFHKAETLL